MATDLLVLGGSGFLGRALVREGFSRGWEVTTFNRGRAPAVDAAVHRKLGDRLDAGTLSTLGECDWDVVVDTWSGAPRAARDSAAILAGHAGRYVYISSCSVYSPPPPLGVDESAETVPASPDAQVGDYAAVKRGAELAIEAFHGDCALLLRPGLILGPGEDVGRLPWWLNRIAAGGEVLAPGPPELRLQYIDARDLAAFALDAAVAGHSGACNVVSRPGHATMATLLEACCSVTGARDTELVWLEPGAVLAAGIEPWTELPIWIPSEHEYAGMHQADVERAHAAGLRCRPLAETVADTWAWLSGLGGAAPLREGLPAPGLDHERERAVLAHAR